MNQKNLNVLLGLLVLALAGVVMYFVWGKQTSVPVLNSLNTTNVNATPNNTTANTNSNQSTKPYTNSKYGLEFMYPKSWYVEDALPGATGNPIFYGQISNYDHASSYNSGNMPTDLESIFYELDNVGAAATLDSLKQQHTESCNVTSFDKFITSAGLEGRKVVRYCDDAPTGNHTSIYFLKNSRQFSFSAGTNSEDQTAVLEQIAKTFKFTK